MIDYEKTKAWRSDPVRHTYTERDTILYALGVGFAADPLVLEELRFVYEKELQAVPTMAAVLASPGFWMRDRKELGIDYLKLVHGEQGVTIHSPLPAAGTLIGQSRVTRIVDKGEGKGATMHVEKTLTDEASGRPVATAEMVAFLRGDGGFSKNGGGDEPVPAAPATPDAAPEVTIEMPTRADAELRQARRRTGPRVRVPQIDHRLQSNGAQRIQFVVRDRTEVTGTPESTGCNDMARRGGDATQVAQVRHAGGDQPSHRAPRTARPLASTWTPRSFTLARKAISSEPSRQQSSTSVSPG